MIEPYQRIVMVANVSTKPISGKYSWTVHNTKEKADREIRSSIYAREQGRHTRLLYQVNVYETKKAAILRNLCADGRIVS